MPDFPMTLSDSRRPLRRAPVRHVSGRRPLVSVLLPTYNRPRYLAEALASAVRQTYRNLEILVIRDGGEEVADVVGSFHDARVVFIDRKENRGKPASLNEALSRAQGKYVAYLDDDDLYYPHHVETLVNVLERQTDFHVAYSDLYKTYWTALPGLVAAERASDRIALSKRVEISRDFDRFLMLYFNHVLHVSLMHRRDLLDRTGLYNESLNVLIDWDMTRRLAFFSDFLHVPAITGEFYSPIGACDRLSFQGRQDPQEYLKNVLTIRATRPPKPWTKIKDLSIILLVDRLDGDAVDTMRRIRRHTFYPYRLYVPHPQADRLQSRIRIPHITFVPVENADTPGGWLDAAMRACDGDYIAVVPGTLPVAEMWLENALHALLKSTEPEGFFLEGATPQLWSAVLRRTDLESARRAYPHLAIEASLAAAGVPIRPPREEELPFQFDELLRQAKQAEANGDWTTTVRLCEHMTRHFQNDLWMKTMIAQAYLAAGDYARAELLSHQINEEQPTVDTLLLEARVHRRKKDYPRAIHLLRQAGEWLKSPVPPPIPAEENSCPA